MYFADGPNVKMVYNDGICIYETEKSHDDALNVAKKRRERYFSQFSNIERMYKYFEFFFVLMVKNTGLGIFISLLLLGCSLIVSIAGIVFLLLKTNSIVVFLLTIFVMRSWNVYKDHFQNEFK